MATVLNSHERSNSITLEFFVSVMHETEQIAVIAL